MDINNVDKAMSNFWGPITSVFGLLVTAIGGLVFGRLVFMSRQIEKDRASVDAEFRQVWERIQNNTDRCNGIHGAISGNMGAVQAKLDDISGFLLSNKQELYEKIDRVTNLFMSEKGEIYKRIGEERQAVDIRFMRLEGRRKND